MDQTCSYFGNQPQCNCKEGRSGPKCDKCAPGFYKYPECIECLCDEAGTIGQSCDPLTGKCNCKSNFAGDKCSECGPELYNYPICEPCTCHPDGTKSDFPGCNKDLRVASRIICPCKDFVHGSQCEKCKDRYFGLGSDSEKGCSPCQCNRDGTLNELDICEQNNGQCHCKLFVDASSCNECKRGFYQLERNNIFGCESCGCQPGSSYDNYCDRITGQCRCLPHIVGAKCDQPEIGHFVPDLHQLRFEIENGYGKNQKPVRYGFDNDQFANFTWKGYVNLNQNTGEVAQNISVSKPGTFRMIIRYLNKNPNITELFVRVRHMQDPDVDEQNATLYLLPNSSPSFETVTTNQISALILELEVADYIFSFESKVENLFIDHFVLLPSDYFESTILLQNVDTPCQDYRDEEACIQYKYPSIGMFSPQLILDESSGAERSVDIDSIKQLNHSYTKPFRAARLDAKASLSKSVKFPNANSYVLLVDFLNTNADGIELNVEITHADSSKKQTGRVYLYKCNITTLCREVVLSKDFNEPLLIDAKDSARVVFSLPPSSQSREVLLYQATAVPKDKFHVNHIKMAPYCIVKSKRCHPLEYQTFQSTRIELESAMDSNGRQDLFRNPAKLDYDYIPANNVIYLHNYYPEASVPVRVSRRDPGDYVLIAHYYQPNHPTVSLTVFLDRKHNATLQAPYCPSTRGCRSILKFDANSETFNDPEFQAATFQLNQNGKDIWLEYLLLAPATSVNPEVFEYAPVDLTSDFISKCASQHFNIEYYSAVFCDQAVLSLSSKYNGGALPCECDEQGSVTTQACDYLGGQCQCKENIIGRQCSRCKTGYFGFPNCQPCNCPTGNCDDSGKCVTAPNVDDLLGNVCIDGFYGFHPIIGCEECSCDPEGSLEGSTVCDKESGQCKCKENMDGLRCDKCKAGFFDYPRCSDCGCHREGATAQVCDAKSAECSCKENVYGQRCDYCKQGTFNLETRNPKGCTSCFCFGITSSCRPSDLFFGPERNFNLNEWKLAYAKSSSEQVIILE